ncbi:MAG: transposase family protein [Saprospiraceae bacterium]|nr:transposase family protein [Saprospiraceae bacterium]
MVALRYRDIREKKDRVLRLTGFQPVELEALCAKFTLVWEKYIKNNTLEGKPRKRQVRKERKNSMLPTSEDKLLFLLYEHKNYPTQEVLATQFGMKQPHANMWLKILRPILQETLQREGDLPQLVSEHLDRAIGERQRVIIDGVERPILRSGDNETQQEECSGKKKTLRQERADFGRR